MRRRDHRRGLMRVFALSTAVVGLLAAGALAQGVLPIEPNFSGNPDILGGRRFLLRIDDLFIVNFTHPPDFAPLLYEARTSKSAISRVQANGGFTSVPNHTPAFGTAVSRADEIAPQALGRMHDLQRDVVVSLLLDLQGQWRVFVADGGIRNFKDTVVPTAIAPATQGRSAQAVVLADVDGDGFLEAVIAYLGQDAQGRLVEAVRIAKALDLKDLTKGVRFGPELISVLGQGAGLFAAPLSTLRVDDVNGDVAPEILGFNGQTLSVATVDPTTLAITVAKTVTLPNSQTVFPFNLIAGRFRNTPSNVDDVVVVGQRDGGRNGLTLYSFAGALGTGIDVALANTQDFSPRSAEVVSHVFLAKGPLRNWFSGQDLLVVGRVDTHKSFVEIFESQPQQLAFSLVSDTTVARGATQGRGCLYGLAVGNFDHRTAQDEHAFGLEIATLWRQLNVGSNYTCSEPSFVESGGALDPLGLRIWSIVPTTKPASGSTLPDWLSLRSDTQPLKGFVDQPAGFASLRAGDLQGRSLVLGAPEKVTIIGHIQPDVVLGLPPMHIDWIDPKATLDVTDFPGCQTIGTPCVLNLTVLPSVPPSTGIPFATQYDLADTSSATSSRKSTTSWSIAVKVSTDSKISFGNKLTDQASVEIKTSAGFTHDGTVSTAYNSYEGKTESIDVTTGFADYVFFTQRVQNIYYYRVIGHETCRDPTFLCIEPFVRHPLYVSFSGPDSVSHQSNDATTLEWYQPPHEPGNVLSYPSTLDQLQLAFASTTSSGSLLEPLTDFNFQGAGDATTKFKTSWSGSQEKSKSSGATNAESSSVSIAVSATARDPGVSSVTASGEFDLNQSTSVQTHNASTQSVSASFGIAVTKPSFPSIVADTYDYRFGSYALGVQNVPPVSQTNITPTDETGKIVDIKANGPVLVAFLADPSSNWWREVYTVAPDVAVNHPERWNWTPSTRTARFADKGGAAPEDSGFYKMKGLFITPEDPTPGAANGLGPTRTVARAGDQMRLTARVHNYSLISTDDSPPTPAARVRVRFYGQKWDTSRGTFGGPGFLIGEDVLGSIPGFSPASDQSSVTNWTFASVTFDTTPFPATALVFWVVVWMEDAQGNLLPEIQDHGLTAKPPAGITDITEMPTEAYSNNVGLYGTEMPFFVLPPKVPGALEPVEGELVVDHVAVPDPPVVVDAKARIVATIRAAGGSRDGVPVAFYDGDPALGGKLFHFQVIPHLYPDEPFVLRGFLRPPFCGPREIVVVAGHSSSGSATGRAAITVTADPATGTGCPPLITALGPASVWVGLTNSDAVGARFDLRAEAYVGRDLVGSGQVNGVSGGSSGFNNAKLASIPLSLRAPLVAPGTTVRLQLSARITCSGATHATAGARLWFNDAQANSRVGISVDGSARSYYLAGASALIGVPGPGPKTPADVTLDSKVACGARPFKPFGTWRVTLP